MKLEPGSMVQWTYPGHEGTLVRVKSIELHLEGDRAAVVVEFTCEIERLIGGSDKDKWVDFGRWVMASTQQLPFRELVEEQAIRVLSERKPVVK